MDSPKEGVQVFHPSSVPVDQAAKQRQERKQSYRSCFYVFIAILALFGGAVIVGASLLATSLFKGFLFPTRQYALHHKHVQHFNASQVHPLIGPAVTFDIQATVWQDVTDLLARGQELPKRDSPWQLVKSEVLVRSPIGVSVNNYTRTEAILYQGKIAQGATLQSKIHNKIPLRIPVAPLYTDNLGPSSLRATFSIAIPDDQAELYGSFRNVSYLYSTTSPILPRRADYDKQKPEQDLNAALADAGVSTSLLELVASPWYRADDHGERAERTIDNSTQVSPFFSAHRRNLRYLDLQAAEQSQPDGQQLPEFQNGHGTILLPHFRTRSRIGMVRAKDVFDNTTFLKQQETAQTHHRLTCNSLSKNGGNCVRLYNRHSFETLLTFTQKPGANSNEHSAQESLYYAPALTQVSAPLSSIFQRRIPHHMPQIGKPEPGTLRGNASAACEIPMADLDASKQYFEFDWQIYFSAHTLQRVMAAEPTFTYFGRPDPAPLLPGAEGDKQLIANMMPDLHTVSAMERFGTGDRLHPNDHPSRIVVGGFAATFWHIVFDEFFLFYFWYTRKTSAGLWIQAQWLWVTTVLLQFAIPILRPFIDKDSNDFSLFVLIWSCLALLHLPFFITTLMHLERPVGHSSAKWWRRNPLAFRRRRLTRRERKSIALADSIDKKPFYLLFTVLYIIFLFEDSGILQFSSPRQCVIDDTGGPASVPLGLRFFDEATRALSTTLVTAHILGQSWFNHKSSTFTGSFRIAAVGTAFFTFVMSLAFTIDAFSGWIDNRIKTPVGVVMMIEVVSQAWFAYQAVTLKGVPQVESDDDDD